MTINKFYVVKYEDEYENFYEGFGTREEAEAYIFLLQNYNRLIEIKLEQIKETGREKNF